MTGEARPFDEHAAFEDVGDEYDATTTEFDATVHPDDGEYHVSVEVPMLDAVVVGEDVAEVVEDGWFETFERRVVDADGVVAGDVTTPTVTRRGEFALVETRLRTAARDAPEEALALITYVEGTWFEGVIPGYEYAAEIQAVRERAMEQGGADGR